MEGHGGEDRERTASIGRVAGAEVQVPSVAVAPRHSVLFVHQGRWVVQDLDSTNGTFLAGERVTVPTPVPPHTPVTIGQTSFELRR